MTVGTLLNLSPVLTVLSLDCRHKAGSLHNVIWVEFDVQLVSGGGKVTGHWPTTETTCQWVCGKLAISYLEAMTGNAFK